MPSTVTVPDGCKVVFVSDQMADRFTDWSRIDKVEAKVVPIEGSSVVVDVVARYISE